MSNKMNEETQQNNPEEVKGLTEGTVKEQAEDTVKDTETSEVQEEKEKTEADKLAEAEQQISELNDKIAELNDKLLRQVADFTNYRRQQQKNIADLILNGGAKVIESILPILDDMERAQQNIASDDNIDVAREGLEMIFSKLQSTLGKHGLSKMDTAEKEFDTDYHEAVAILPMGEEKKGKIIDTVQAGYMMNDKVLRHAKVVVGQ